MRGVDQHQTGSVRTGGYYTRYHQCKIFMESYFEEYNLRKEHEELALNTLYAIHNLSFYEWQGLPLDGRGEQKDEFQDRCNLPLLLTTLLDHESPELVSLVLGTFGNWTRKADVCAWLHGQALSSFFVVLLQHLDTNVVENAAGCLLNLLCYERNVLAGTDSTDALHAHSLHEQITSDEVSWSALIGLVLQNDGDDPRKLELPGRILLLCLGMGARLPVTQLRKKQVRDLLPSLCIDSTMKERLLELCQPRDQ